VATVMPVTVALVTVVVTVVVTVTVTITPPSQSSYGKAIGLT